MTPLPTLGGNNGWVVGFNGAVNKRGQVVGIAETATRDPNCIPPQVLDSEAVIWGPKAGEIHELPLLPGDSVSGAAAINDHGQVVGGAGPICGPPSTAGSLHAVLWRDGSVIDLGSFGGAMNNVAWAINNHDQIAGFSDLPGDQTTHAFLWQRGEISDLGTLPGDVASFAYGINDNGHVVGQSLDQSGNSHSFLWKDGVMTDLNTLTPPGSSLYVIQPFSINSESEIVGQAFDQNSGEVLPVLMIPCDEKHVRAAGCDDQAWSGTDTQGRSERPNVILPESVREQLRTRRGFGQFAQLVR
jgi:probable HAF family extracellular repeat protein